MLVGHIAPEARDGGTIALLREGDMITIDAYAKTISVDLPEKEISRRKAGWKQKDIAYKSGALAKYARLVSSASKGAVTGRSAAKPREGAPGRQPNGIPRGGALEGGRTD